MSEKRHVHFEREHDLALTRAVADPARRAELLAAGVNPDSKNWFSPIVRAWWDDWVSGRRKLAPNKTRAIADPALAPPPRPRGRPVGTGKKNRKG